MPHRIPMVVYEAMQLDDRETCESFGLDCDAPVLRATDAQIRELAEGVIAWTMDGNSPAARRWAIRKLAQLEERGQ